MLSSSWALEQRFTPPPPKFGVINNLHKLQSISGNVVKCHIVSAQELLSTTNDFAVYFSIDPNPLQPRFVLQLRLRPSSTKNVEDYRTDRITAYFSACQSAGPDGLAAAQRTPFAYQGRTDDPPSANSGGPLYFSDQLHDVIFSSPSAVSAAAESEYLPKWTNQPADDQNYFSWRSQGCTILSASRSVSGVTNEAAQAVETFLAILADVTSKHRGLQVVTLKETRVRSITWPWFAALPEPTPPSYWPWLQVPGDDPSKIMDFSAKGSFELNREWIDCALGIRSDSFFRAADPKQLEDCKNPPNPVILATLPEVIQYTDGREYVAHVLGSHSYEEEQTTKIKYTYCNGIRACDILPDDHGTRGHVVLLRLRLPAFDKTDASAAAQEAGGPTVLPETGERVHMTVKIGVGQEDWHGKVVRIPAKHQKFGWTVAILAVRPPSDQAAITTQIRTEADFYFGHLGSPVGALRTTIVKTMADVTVSGASFWPRLLLAQDNHAIPDNKYEGDMPDNWRALFEEQFFKPRGLNQEQKDAIIHFFSHRVTLLVGPPGTGKSTVVDVILETFASRKDASKSFWACTDSNAALDVLAYKFTDTKKTENPPGYFRIRPMFDENLPDADEEALIGLSGASTLPGHRLPKDFSASLAEQLSQATDASQLMSLGAFIKLRLDTADSPDGLANVLWSEEQRELEKLVEARKAVEEVERDRSTKDHGVAAETKLRKNFLTILRSLQIRYVGAARGIFTTAAATSGMLLKKVNPQILVMDESSQFHEAKAAHIILHAANAGSLNHVILVGDHHQLPPTVMAIRNPFKPSGKVSLFERLIRAGTSYIQLREQYRSHPTISAFYNQHIYKGTLRDALVTKTGPNVDKFVGFIKSIARESGIANFPTTCSVVIQPVKSKEYRWGSEKRDGSTSKVNYQTAAMALVLAHRLVVEGKFAAKDVLITSFYADQVMTLQALTQGIAVFKGLRIKTVDSSQGSEALVQIIDCVVLGAAANETIGFLSTDRRRTNVAMSRGKVGRIVLAHKEMTMGKMDPQQKSLWSQFLKAENVSRNIIQGGSLLSKWPVELQNRYRDVTQSMRASQKVTDNVATVPHMTVRKKDAAIMFVIDATGASEEKAEAYLQYTGGVVDRAIDKYLEEH